MVDYCINCDKELHPNNRTDYCPSCLGAGECAELAFLDGQEVDD